MTCKVYMSEIAKLLENRGSLRFLENKMKPKTCKLLVNSILALVNTVIVGVSEVVFCATIEWE